MHESCCGFDEGVRSKPLKGALAGTDFDLRSASPQLATDIQSAVGALLINAQQAGTVRGDLDIADITAMVAGIFAAMEHLDGDPPHRAHLTGVLLDALRIRRGIG